MEPSTGSVADLVTEEPLTSTKNALCRSTSPTFLPISRPLLEAAREGADQIWAFKASMPDDPCGRAGYLGENAVPKHWEK